MRESQAAERLNTRLVQAKKQQNGEVDCRQLDARSWFDRLTTNGEQVNTDRSP